MKVRLNSEREHSLLSFVHTSQIKNFVVERDQSRVKIRVEFFEK
jgi:hypothetical protein